MKKFQRAPFWCDVPTEDLLHIMQQVNATVSVVVLLGLRTETLRTTQITGYFSPFQAGQLSSDQQRTRRSDSFPGSTSLPTPRRDTP